MNMVGRREGDEGGGCRWGEGGRVREVEEQESDEFFFFFKQKTAYEV